MGAEPDGPLRQLAATDALDRIREVLGEFGRLAGDDPSSIRLRDATRGEIDLAVRAHRAALLGWLRSWGCRHLRVADSARSSRALARWWGAYRTSLPAVGRSLASMRRRELEAAAAAFDALAAASAAWRATPDGRVNVSFGETAAAKALFALRPLAFPPWDEPIRAALGLHGGEGYRSYLEQVAFALGALAARLEVPVSEVPEALGRPGDSPPKLVDEYLWMRVNRAR